MDFVETLHKAYRVVNNARFKQIQESVTDALPARDLFEFVEVRAERILSNRFEENTGGVIGTHLLIKAVYDFESTMARLIAGNVLSMRRFTEKFSEYLTLSTCGTTDQVDTLLAMLWDFMVLLAKYPIVPASIIDTKNCCLCFFDTDFSLAYAEKRISGIMCVHFLDLHECYNQLPQVTVAKQHIFAKPASVLSLDSDDFFAHIFTSRNIPQMIRARYAKDNAERTVDQLLPEIDRMKTELLNRKIDSTIAVMRDELQTAVYTRTKFHGGNAWASRAFGT